MTESDKKYRIRAVERAIIILTKLSDGHNRSLTELSEELGLSQTTTFRLLATLAMYSLVERDPHTGKYRIGLTCLKFAHTYYEGNDLRNVALSELEQLRDDTGETVHLGVLEKLQVIYLEKLPGHHAIGLMSSRVGGSSPAYCTGLGKAMLAYVDPKQVKDYFEKHGLRRYTVATIQNVPELLVNLERIRGLGFALDNGEHEAEVRCVASPIFDRAGQVIGAISVSGPAGRLDPLDSNFLLINRTQQAAEVISSRLGYMHRQASAGNNLYAVRGK